MTTCWKPFASKRNMPAMQQQRLSKKRLYSIYWNNSLSRKKICGQLWIV